MKNFRIYLFSFSLLLLVTCSPTLSEEELNITKDLECSSVSQPLPLLEYANGKSTLEFQKINHDSLNFGFSKDSYICKWENTIENSHSQMDRLIIGISLQDYLDILYLNRDGSHLSIETGDRRSVSPYVLSDYPYEFKINLKEVKTIFFQLSTHDGLHEGLTFDLTTSTSYQKTKLLSTSFQFFLIGALASLILYNLLIVLDSKEKAHFYFVGYLISFLMYYIIYVGIFSHSPNSSFLNNSGMLIAANLTIIFINLFIVHSIGLQEPKLNRHLYALLGIYSLNILLNFLTLYALSLQIISLAVAYNTLIFFPMLFYFVYKAKNIYAYRLLLSFVPLAIGGVIFICKIASILESNLFTENAYFIGSLLQIILFSFLLSQKFTTSVKLNLEYQKKILLDSETFATALQEEKERVTNAYFELEASQKQLIQSDRMITLGTLVAGVAHEINTPLGAIKASGENINISLNSLMGAISDVIPDSLREDWSLVTKILEKSQTLSQSLSSKESRSLKKKIKENLETQEVERAEEIAEIFLELGIYKDDSLQKEILSTLGYVPILNISHLMFGILKKAKTIEISADRVSKIVKSLKSYMHFDSSEEMVPAALYETIETVLTILHSKLKAGIEVQTNYESVPFIYCFPDELGQIITNLIHNSIQALEGTGKISIEVKTIGIPDLHSIHSPFPISIDEHNSFDEKYIFDKFLTLSIEDNGPGIPDEIQKKIFEPFFTTKKAGEGSGLGLHIIRKIIDKHNGYLELFSKPGSTKFTVGIPARIALKPNPPTP